MPNKDMWDLLSQDCEPLPLNSHVKYFLRCLILSTDENLITRKNALYLLEFGKLPQEALPMSGAEPSTVKKKVLLKKEDYDPKYFISVIKAVREASGMGLKDAKDAVDNGVLLYSADENSINRLLASLNQIHYGLAQKITYSPNKDDSQTNTQLTQLLDGP